LPRRGAKRTGILAVFDKSELMDAVGDGGRVELQVVGALKTGQHFNGKDTVWIIAKTLGGWPFLHLIGSGLAVVRLSGVAALTLTKILSLTSWILRCSTAAVSRSLKTE